MIRSLAFNTQGRLHTKDIETFLMPTLLADTNLFLWVDLENPTPEEAHRVLESIFHFHPLSIEDCVAVSESPKVEEYTPKEDDRFTAVQFLVKRRVDGIAGPPVVDAAVHVHAIGLERVVPILDFFQARIDVSHR